MVRGLPKGGRAVVVVVVVVVVGSGYHPCIAWLMSLGAKWSARTIPRSLGRSGGLTTVLCFKAGVLVLVPHPRTVARCDTPGCPSAPFHGTVAMFSLLPDRSRGSPQEGKDNKNKSILP
jgi:hypothetical protein